MSSNWLKDRFLGIPEPGQSLEQAYQAALKIEFIEGRYFSGNKVCNNANIEFPQAEFEENLDILKQRMKEFNASTSTLGKLGQDHLMRLIFVEGILAKYTTTNPDTSTLAPISSTTTSSPLVNQKSYPSATNIINVKSVPSGKRKKQTSKDLELQAYTESDNGKPGVLPKSIKKTIDKVKNDLNPGSEEEVVNAFRRSRAITVIGLRLLALLIVVPLLTQQISKNFLILPIVEKYRGEEAQVFLNSEMKEEALQELNTYKEELELESLITSAPRLSPEATEEKVKDKAVEITEEYRHKSSSALSNVFADMVALFAFALVLLFKRQDIAVLKSFIDNIVYGLSDSAKAFAIILTTDIFVGFHSPHGWEVLLESLAAHLGVAANRSAISLFIATVPVVADTMVKYWIFRELSRMSPSTMATLKEMDD